MTTNQDEIQKYLNDLYQDVSTFQISAEARQKSNLSNDSTYVYGETTMKSLFDMVNEMSPKPGEVFYDLGSGGGKTLLFAALSFPFSKCVGVELLADLVGTAKTHLAKLQQDVTTMPFIEQPFNKIVDFINDDFLKTDFSDADIIYTYSTCFGEELMQNMGNHLGAQLKTGSRVITITKQLSSPQFTLTKQGKYPMEWGEASVFFYEKI